MQMNNSEFSMAPDFHTRFRPLQPGRTKVVAPARRWVAAGIGLAECLPTLGGQVVSWIKRVLLVLVAAFVVFYLFTRPEAAAEAVKTFFGAFEALGTFFTSLAS
jgi:hypothetical protein